MIEKVRTAVLAVVAFGGAGLWAYGMAVLQPLCEPGSPWWDDKTDLSYGARDVRWGAALACCLALVVLARGARSAVAVAGVGVVVWAGVDLVLDRADVGGSALLPLLSVAGAVVAAAAVGCRRAGRAMVSPDRHVFGVVAAIAIPVGLAVSFVTSGRNAEPELVWAVLPVVALHAGVGLVVALETATPFTRARAMAVTVAAVIWVVALAIRAVTTENMLAWLWVEAAVSGLLLTGIWWLGRSQATPWERTGMTFAGGLMTPALFFGLLFATSVFDLLSPLTRWAGSVPGIDGDVSWTTAGLLTGLSLAFGALTTRSDGSRRTAPPASTATGPHHARAGTRATAPTRT
ncbi:hypothetical protein ACWT_3283 [Actinoplanes sp. SE50]|uniref:hypothetical protein n=1 Tax=unclassified Actinoplanes TaxID=2626549 RepID=UPI00023ECCAB|nr:MULTISPECIES: hypothetical protein [unclassified Actinoplanes]AEV84306.1 hypothetical protein ACPL_3411 [Actinoplanes sp. SE50/110]ATO82698.1 hypothetical protein ACWT_3283 [Actinoplanes sp. SE50]SLM00105.1 hypothetical protein ACSP50_3337 [Actinoplanes sp. SE50/110]